jgi:hypothetical protein
MNLPYVGTSSHNQNVITLKFVQPYELRNGFTGWFDAADNVSPFDIGDLI